MMRTSAIASTLGLLTVLLPLGLAEPGNDGGLIGLRLEGENYRSAKTGCDPDGFGENTKILNQADASGGQATMIPNDQCSITYRGVLFTAQAHFGSFRALNTGLNGPEPVRITVAIDGIATYQGDYTAGVARYQNGGFGPWSSAPLNPIGSAKEIAPGTHDVTISYQMLRSQEMPYLTKSDLVLDYLDLRTACRALLAGGLCTQAETAQAATHEGHSAAAGASNAATAARRDLTGTTIPAAIETIESAAHDGCRTVLAPQWCPI